MLLGVTKVISGFYFGRYELEAIYSTAFLIACLAMLLLSKWSVRSMMSFIAIVAVLFVSCKTARMLFDSSNIGTYTVAVPVNTGTVSVPYETSDDYKVELPVEQAVPSIAIPAEDDSEGVKT